MTPSRLRLRIPNRSAASCKPLNQAILLRRRIAMRPFDRLLHMGDIEKVINDITTAVCIGTKLVGMIASGA